MKLIFCGAPISEAIRVESRRAMDAVDPLLLTQAVRKLDLIWS
jgi:hypothetical protein